MQNKKGFSKNALLIIIAGLVILIAIFIFLPSKTQDTDNPNLNPSPSPTSTTSRTSTTTESPTPTPTATPNDLNNDGNVNELDTLAFFEGVNSYPDFLNTLRNLLQLANLPGPPVPAQVVNDELNIAGDDVEISDTCNPEMPDKHDCLFTTVGETPVVWNPPQTEPTQAEIDAARESAEEKALDRCEELDTLGCELMEDHENENNGNSCSGSGDNCEFLSTLRNDPNPCEVTKCTYRIWSPGATETKTCHFVDLEGNIPTEGIDCSEASDYNNPTNTDIRIWNCEAEVNYDYTEYECFEGGPGGAV